MVFLEKLECNIHNVKFCNAGILIKVHMAKQPAFAVYISA